MVVESTVAKYMARHRKRPSQTWRTFLKDHVPGIVAIDFFVVATVSFRLLYCFIVLRHERRRVVHFNVTPYPTVRWTAQQGVEALPFDEAPRFLIRDHDGIYVRDFRERIKHLGIKEVISAHRSPWQSPCVERLISSIRRECLDHLIVLNEARLLRILAGYFACYHEARTHLSLDRNAPIPRAVEPPTHGRVIATPEVGGLHHRYTRVA
jgi:putative transposase